MNWLRYSNQNATRNLPLDDKLIQAFSFLPELGLEMEVFSGGQPAIGSGLPRVGATNHDHGGAADVFFHRGGQRLDWANPEHTPIFEQIVQRARAGGATSFGAGQGYMQPGSMHVGLGAPRIWGAGGKGANAPDWLRRSFGGATGPAAPAATPAGAQLTFGPKVPTAAMDPLTALFGSGPEDLSMGAPVPQMPNRANRQEALARQEEATAQRRKALFEGLGSYFS